MNDSQRLFSNLKVYKFMSHSISLHVSTHLYLISNEITGIIVSSL